MEKKAPTIPFHSAHSAPPMAAQQMAGPCALAMALGALGWDLGPGHLVRGQDGRRRPGTRLHDSLA